MFKNENLAFIFFLIFALVAICLCTFDLTKPVKSKNSAEKTTPIIEGVQATEFEYNGHTYIKFYFNNKCSVVHSPDCKCLDDAKDLIDNMQMEYYD